MKNSQKTDILTDKNASAHCLDGVKQTISQNINITQNYR